jgi:hypothetical protein
VSRSALLASLVAVALLGVVLVIVLGGDDDDPAPVPDAEDPVAERVLGELDGYLGWLDEHEVEGFVGEVSWPSDDPTGEWTALAESWLDRVADADVPVSYWAAGEVFDPESIPYLAYASSEGPNTPVDTVLPPGELLEERWDDQPLGLNSAGGSYNACATREVCDVFDASSPGRLGQEWLFDSTETLEFYADRGVETLRVELRWERIQPELGGPFDEEVAGEFERVLDDAERLGMDVILDLHNYGSYYVEDEDTGDGVRLLLGDELDAGLLTDIWFGLAGRFGDHPAISAYGLMNEPRGMGVDAWEAMSAATVEALRDSGDDTPIYVGGYDLSNVHSWPHEEPWVDADGVVYEAHHHLDRFHGAAYEYSYAEEIEYELTER